MVALLRYPACEHVAQHFVWHGKVTFPTYPALWRHDWERELEVVRCWGCEQVEP